MGGLDHARTIPARAAVGGVLEKRLQDKRICICTGSGGVGKTTVSAAIALALARRGQRAVVVTIDPARRLAGALGMASEPGARKDHDHAPGEPVRVPLDPLGESPGTEGELWALTLDVPSAFDELLAELAPDEQTRAAIHENHIYHELSSAVAGSQEIAAVAKLFDLYRGGHFDVIVLDTPPAQNALDFLDAPTRMAGFLEGRAASMFLAAGSIATGRGGEHASPAREPSGSGGERRAGLARLVPGAVLPRVIPRSLAARLLGGSTALLLSLFARATGVEVVRELALFFRLLGGMSDGLRERAHAVEALLRDPVSTFAIVTSPEYEAAREAEFLRLHLAELAMPYGALIVNRVHQGALDGEPEPGYENGLRQELSSQVGPRLAERLMRNLADVEVLARRDREAIAELSRALDERQPVCVRQMGAEVDTLAGLSGVAQQLFD